MKQKIGTLHISMSSLRPAQNHSRCADIEDRSSRWPVSLDALFVGFVRDLLAQIEPPTTVSRGSRRVKSILRLKRCKPSNLPANQITSRVRKRIEGISLKASEGEMDFVWYNGLSRAFRLHSTNRHSLLERAPKIVATSLHGRRRVVACRSLAEALPLLANRKLCMPSRAHTQESQPLYQRKSFLVHALREKGDEIKESMGIRESCI